MIKLGLWRPLSIKDVITMRYLNSLQSVKYRVEGTSILQEGLQ